MPSRQRRPAATRQARTTVEGVIAESVPGRLVAPVRAEELHPVAAGEQVLEVPVGWPLSPMRGQAGPQRAGAGGR